MTCATLKYPRALVTISSRTHKGLEELIHTIGVRKVLESSAESWMTRSGCAGEWVYLGILSNSECLWKQGIDIRRSSLVEMR